MTSRLIKEIQADIEEHEKLQLLAAQSVKLEAERLRTLRNERDQAIKDGGTTGDMVQDFIIYFLGYLDKKVEIALRKNLDESGNIALEDIICLEMCSQNQALILNYF